jgi:hypothetical protein
VKHVLRAPALYMNISYRSSAARRRIVVHFNNFTEEFGTRNPIKVSTGGRTGMPQSAVLLGPGDVFRPIQPKIGRCLYGKFYVSEETVSFFNPSFPSLLPMENTLYNANTSTKRRKPKILSSSLALNSTEIGSSNSSL